MLQRLQCAFGTCCSARLAHVSMTSRPRMGEWFNIGKQHPNVCSKAPTPPTRPRLLMIRRRRARAPCEFDRRRRKTIRGGGGGCQRGASALRAGRNAELQPVAAVLERLTPARHRIVSASWHSELSPSQCALALGLCLGAAHTFQGGRLLLHVLRTVVPSGDAQKESSSTLPEEEGKD